MTMSTNRNHVAHRAAIPDRPAATTIGHRCEDSMGQDVYRDGATYTWCSHGWSWWTHPPVAPVVEREALSSNVKCRCGCGQMLEAGRDRRGTKYRAACSVRINRERESRRGRARGVKEKRERQARGTARPGQGQWSKGKP